MEKSIVHAYHSVDEVGFVVVGKLRCFLVVLLTSVVF